MKNNAEEVMRIDLSWAQSPGLLLPCRLIPRDGLRPRAVWSVKFEDLMELSVIASLVAQTVKASAYSARDPDSIPGLGRSPGEGNGTLVFLPGKFHGWRSLVGYSPWGWKELDTTERLHFHFLLHCRQILDILSHHGSPLWEYVSLKSLFLNFPNDLLTFQFTFYM